MKSQPYSLGTWTRMFPNGSTDQELFLFLNADKATIFSPYRVLNRRSRKPSTPPLHAGPSSAQSGVQRGEVVDAPFLHNLASHASA